MLVGSQILIQGSKLPTSRSCLFLTDKRVNFSPFFSKLMGSATHSSKIDGFHGSHGALANGAIDERFE